MKRLIIILYTLLLVLLATATLVEHSQGSEWVSAQVYHTNWFCGLWAVLTAFTVWAVCHTNLRKRPSVVLLHLSFVAILCGAGVSFLTSHKGMVHLVMGQRVQHFIDNDSRTQQPLPFVLSLDSFNIVHYPGTEAASDYVTCMTLTHKDGTTARVRVSMNQIAKQEGYRFYQSSYDEDGMGSWLSVNYDPWGTGITYFGYILLALAMLWVLVDRREEFRRLLNHPLLKKGGLFVVLLGAISLSANATPRALPAFNRAKADSLATKQVVYNDRVAPFNTLARDFVLKLYGKTSYEGLSPEQVVSGWLLRPDAWQNEPMILIKSEALRQQLHVEGKYARLIDLFDNNGYKLQRLWKGANAMTNTNDPLQKAVMEVDEKVEIILMLQQGKLIQPLPKDGSVAPLSNGRIQAELFYNRIPFTQLLFMACLTLGLLAFARIIYRSVHADARQGRIDQVAFPIALYVCTTLLLVAFCLRWYVAGHVPMSNGFETMQFMALATLLVSCVLHQRFGVLLPFGFMVAGFSLLVSYLGQSNPQITNLMPVLASPWLSLHVSVVMMGYSLLAFLLFTGILGLCLPRQAERMMLMGRLLLYPAVFFLGIGIFLGAVWANQSWGTYWSWDPKETWALITFMVYAIGFHASSLPWLRRPRNFNVFAVLAFLTVLMTYFGVNFILGGMHSYAG